MPVNCWQVDAFAERPFTGNPAAVCWLEEQRDPSWMQSVATEMNLSATAFVRRADDGFELRWFTPRAEINLCGHATLATAHVLWTAGFADTQAPIQFHSKSGRLTCTRAGEAIELDFPAVRPAAVAAPEGLLAALNVQPSYVGWANPDYLVVVETAEIVRSLRPDFARLSEIPARGVSVTALADDPKFDFVSRFFAPAFGIQEDPVTGSAHCYLGPYWAARLGKNDLRAWQASPRGGALEVRISGDRVTLAGRAVTIWQGTLLLPRSPTYWILTSKVIEADQRKAGK